VLLLLLVFVAAALLSVPVVEVVVSDGGESVVDCREFSFLIPTEERDLWTERRIDGQHFTASLAAWDRFKGIIMVPRIASQMLLMFGWRVSLFSLKRSNIICWMVSTLVQFATT
jgi:hypothetical protein